MAMKPEEIRGVVRMLLWIVVAAEDEAPLMDRAPVPATLGGADPPE
jgi:hypothetical protein